MEPKTRHREGLKEDGMCDWNCRFRDEKGNCLMVRIEEVLMDLTTAIDRKRDPREGLKARNDGSQP